MTRDVILLDAKTNLNVSAAVELGDQVRGAKVFIEWDAESTGGAVTVEEAYTSGETKTWAVIKTVTWSAASSVDTVSVEAPFRSIRTRISSAITGVGGSVTTRLVAR